MTNRGRRCFANRRETVQLPLKPGTPIKIYYLNPPYADLSIENEVLEGTGIELVPATVQSEQDVISLTQEAAATLTAHVPINAGIADHLRNCRIIVRLGVGYDIIDIESCKKPEFWSVTCRTMERKKLPITPTRFASPFIAESSSRIEVSEKGDGVTRSPAPFIS